MAGAHGRGDAHADTGQSAGKNSATSKAILVDDGKSPDRDVGQGVTVGGEVRRPAGSFEHPAGGPLLRQGPEVVAQRVGDEVILVNLQTNRMHSLNRTGARLWDLLTAGQDLAGIHAQLQAEFDVDPAQLRQEIETIVAALKDAGLVVAESA